MTQKANEELLTTLCKKAAIEQNHNKLMDLVREITTLLDAQEQRRLGLISAGGPGLHA